MRFAVSLTASGGGWQNVVANGHTLACGTQRFGEATVSDQVRLTQDGGKIVSAQLCRQGNGYVYVISVLQPDGQVKNVSVSAD